MNFESVMRIIGKLSGTLKFFPSDPDARLGIAEEISEMAGDEDQVRWLVSRIPKLYREWPAMHEVRAVFCSKFKPRDGIEVYSQDFPDGIPSEKESMPALPAPAMRQLPAGEPVTAAPSIAATLSDLVRAKDMNRTIAGLPPPKVREIPVVQITDKNRITAEDIRQAEREMRDSKARKEIEVSR